MGKGIYIIILLVVSWVNRYFWFLPRYEKIDLEPYSIAVQAVDDKTSKRLDNSEFFCHVYGDEGDYAKYKYEDGICYFYDLEPETNYIVRQTSFVGSYIPEIWECTVYVNADGSIDYLSNCYVDGRGILTFKNYLAGRNFYSNNTRFWVVLGGISVVSISLLVVSILFIYKLEHKN